MFLRCSKVLCRHTYNKFSCFLSIYNDHGFTLSKKLHFSPLLYSPSPCTQLTEFFDDQKNLGEEHISAGRPWKLDELRIKSNVDLHKLWYVLLKERNMLLTMEHEYREKCELFPSPDRIEKVEEGMESVMAVVKERNEAVSLLETGTTGRPGGRWIKNFLGLRVWKENEEHKLPSHLNKFFHLLYPKQVNKRTDKYIALYREQQREEAVERNNRAKKRRGELFEQFPHLEGES